MGCSRMPALADAAPYTAGAAVSSSHAGDAVPRATHGPPAASALWARLRSSPIACALSLSASLLLLLLVTICAGDPAPTAASLQPCRVSRPRPAPAGVFHWCREPVPGGALLVASHAATCAVGAERRTLPKAALTALASVEAFARAHHDAALPKLRERVVRLAGAPAGGAEAALAYLARLRAPLVAHVPRPALDKLLGARANARTRARAPCVRSPLTRSGDGHAPEKVAP